MLKIENNNGKYRFIGYSIIVNSIILAVFIFLLPSSFQNNENRDYINEYNPIALNIINSKSYNYYDSTYCNETCEVDIHFSHLRRPPVFPIFIAFSHKLSSLINVNQYDLLICLQYLLHIVSSMFIYLMYLTWFHKYKIAFFASILWTSYPLTLYLLKQPNSEVIFNFLLAFFALLFSISLKNNDYLKGYILYFAGLLLDYFDMHFYLKYIYN